MNYLFEHSAAVLVALELIEAGAGWSQKNDIARRGGFTGAPDGVFQSFRMFHFGSTLNLRFDLGGRGPYRVHALHSLPQQVAEHGVVAALILAAENQVQMRRNVRRERFQRLDRGVNVRGFRVVDATIKALE